MGTISDTMKKVLLAGIGSVAVTAEKSKEVLDDLVKKGELTVEQGKVLNEELKHNVKQTVKENVNVSMKPTEPEDLLDLIQKMTPEQLSQLKAQLAAADNIENASDSDETIDDKDIDDEDIEIDDIDVEIDDI